MGFGDRRGGVQVGGKKLNETRKSPSTIMVGFDELNGKENPHFVFLIREITDQRLREIIEPLTLVFSNETNTYGRLNILRTFLEQMEQALDAGSISYEDAQVIIRNRVDFSVALSVTSTSAATKGSRTGVSLSTDFVVKWTDIETRLGKIEKKRAVPVRRKATPIPLPDQGFDTPPTVGLRPRPMPNSLLRK